MELLKLKGFYNEKLIGMVREGRLREKKYEIKFDPDIVKQRFEGLKDISIEQEKQHLVNLAEIEDIIKKQILEPKGLSTLQIKDYLLFARSIYGLTQKISSGFSGETLRKEELAKRLLFVTRGLDDEILKEISRNFGIDPLPLPKPPFVPEYRGLIVNDYY
ncbi:MAG: hypothetical protein QW423_03450 [Candidatus Aenigmatarchaeota archaeon]